MEKFEKEKSINDEVKISPEIKTPEDVFIKDKDGKIVAYENKLDIFLTERNIEYALDYAKVRGIVLANRKEAEGLAKKLIRENFKKDLEGIDENNAIEN